MSATYKGCRIYRSKACAGRFVWDDTVYGAESDDAFDTLEDAKADVDRFFGDGAPPRVVAGEVVAMAEG